MQRPASVGSFIWVLHPERNTPPTTRKNNNDHLLRAALNNNLKQQRNHDGKPVLNVTLDNPICDVRNIDNEERQEQHVEIKKKRQKDLKINKIKTYKRRFYVLLLFSMTSFMQYCCWNTFGPISTTSMQVFDWTEGEIAIMASLDPFTYLITIFFFSWLMDVKGLRVSLIVSIFFMTFGTGIRCVTTDNNYITWTVVIGQFFNGLGGPVTQAGPPLLSTIWFPPTERTTATAVAALFGSLGVAFSFIIGPGIVKELPGHLQPSVLERFNISLNSPTFMSKSQFLSETTFKKSIHYWSFDDVADVEDREIFKHIHCPLPIGYIEDHKTGRRGYLFGNLTRPPDSRENSIQVGYDDSWLDLGESGDNDNCFFKPASCTNGLAIAFWLNFKPITAKKQFLIGTAGVKSHKIGFLVTVVPIDENFNLSIQVTANRNTSWKTESRITPNSWLYITVTWHRDFGLNAYLNGTRVASTNESFVLKNYQETNIDRLTVGKVNNANKFASAYLDDLAMWQKYFSRDEVMSMFKEVVAVDESVFDDYVAQVTANQERKSDIMMILYIEFAVNALLFVLVLIYFPDKPPQPPSTSAYAQRSDFMDGLIKLLRNPQFWTLSTVYGLVTGIYSGWGAVLNVNLAGFGVSQKEAGWLGFYTVFAGVAAGMLLARCADKFSGRMKPMLLLMFVGSTGFFLWFSLLCLRIAHFTKESLYKSAIFGGFFVSGTIPLFYELTIEQTYPVAEGITTGVLTLVNNLVTILFLVVLIIPNVGHVWMNWVLFCSCAICIPVLVLMHERYNRLGIDLAEQKDLLTEIKNGVEAVEEIHT